MSHTKTFNNTTYNIPDSGDTGWADLTTYLDALADNSQTINSQKIAKRAATATPVTVAATTDCYIGVNVATASAVNLPAGVDKQVFIIADESGAAATNNITITPNGANTINGAASFVLNQNKQSLMIVFSSTDWKIIANSSANTPVISVTDSARIDFTLTSGTLTADIVSDSITNTYINASAAIARTKLASGTASHVVINDGSGVMSSEAQLDRTRGGTGISSTATFPSSGIVVTRDATETLTNKSFNTQTTLLAANELRFNNAGNTFYTGLKGGAAAANKIWTLPLADGSASQVLTTDGSANLSWSTVATTVGAVAANDSNVTFTNSDNRHQVCTPTAARTYTLPTTSISAGDTWFFYNSASTITPVITLQSSGGNTVSLVPPLGIVRLVANTSTPTTAAHWTVESRQSNWVSFTPTFTGLGTVSSLTAFCRVIGDSQEIRLGVTTGTPTAVTARMTTPYGINTSKVVAISGSELDLVGTGTRGVSGTANVVYNVLVDSTDSGGVYFSRNDASVSTIQPQNGNGIFSASEKFRFFNIKIPISS